MTADHQEHRAHLQRIAFGRADSPAEQERADEALRQLQQAEANDIRDAEPTTATYRAIVGADAEQHDAADAAADLRHERFAHAEASFDGDFDVDEDGKFDGNFDGSARPASVLDRPLSSLPRSVLPVIAIGLIAIGAIGGVAATGTSAASPSASPSGLPSGIPMLFDERPPLEVATSELPLTLAVGDLDSAERWFTGEQTPEDMLPMPIDMIVPTTTRLVFQAPGKEAWSVWVGRSSREIGFCLSVFHPQNGMSESTCGSAENFVSSGLGIADGTGMNVNWDGAGVSATRTR